MDLEDIFEDEELRRLSELYPVQATLGKHYDFWKSDNVTYLHSAGFFLNSPAQDSVAEQTFLGLLLQYAAKCERWVGFKTGLKTQSLEEFIKVLQQAKNSDAAAKAIASALNADMIKLDVYQGHLCIFPTEKYVRFIQERARR